jgi:hypothetical protein
MSNGQTVCSAVLKALIEKHAIIINLKEWHTVIIQIIMTQSTCNVS